MDLLVPLIFIVLAVISLILNRMAIGGRNGTKIKGTNATIRSNSWLFWTLLSIVILILIYVYIFKSL